MQRPAEMQWSSPKCVGSIPSKRSGHSFSQVGDYIYLFGGNDYRKPAGPNNELYKLDMNSNDGKLYALLDFNYNILHTTCMLPFNVPTVLLYYFNLTHLL
jgi:hypothetical protein